ncbi:hypothetical protein KUM42_08265 [Modestobacter sp. L9-4]|uniref:hypothetical protein n=1 Tax=Modestobacter sp. L9-4 TaxID=2851567 RepID=UPI001C790330|nr:hypothetical protein [Modestobacter sp. L9-4]QXG77484.1 hypothetical protein KUM42_08265 [Modestobacter sp. L9-4]
MTSPAIQIGRWWYTLDEFLDRAERVLSSEIARREDLATVGTTMKLIASVLDGAVRWSIQRQVPREADIESAATRVRPLFLQDDPVFYGKVTNAIGGLARSAGNEHKATIKALKEAWRTFDKSYRWAVAVSKEPNFTAGQFRNDRQIARDFLYGDLVHADADARQRLANISPEERLLAAVVWVADATRLTLATKQLIVDLTDAGALAARPGDTT